MRETSELYKINTCLSWFNFIDFINLDNLLLMLFSKPGWPTSPLKCTDYFEETDMCDLNLKNVTKTIRRR